MISIFDSLSFINSFKHSLLCFESVTNGKKICLPLAALSISVYFTEVTSDTRRLLKIFDVVKEKCLHYD